MASAPWLYFYCCWFCCKSWIGGEGDQISMFRIGTALFQKFAETEHFWRISAYIWKWKSLSHVWLFATPWTIQSMEFSMPEYWSGWPFPFLGDLPNPGIKSRSPALQMNSLPAAPQGKHMKVKEQMSFGCLFQIYGKMWRTYPSPRIGECFISLRRSSTHTHLKKT